MHAYRYVYVHIVYTRFILFELDVRIHPPDLWSVLYSSCGLTHAQILYRGWDGRYRNDYCVDITGYITYQSDTNQRKPIGWRNSEQQP